MRAKRHGERDLQLTSTDGIKIATACWAASGQKPSIVRFLRAQQEMQDRLKEQIALTEKRAQQRQAREQRLGNRDRARGVCSYGKRIGQRAAQSRAKKTTQRLQEAQEKTNGVERHLHETEQRLKEKEKAEQLLKEQREKAEQRWKEERDRADEMQKELEMMREMMREINER